jgi:hypothetical protein
MADVLPLVGDGDEDDLVHEVESAFGIRFAPQDLEACHTVGDLYDLVLALVPNAERTGTACLTARAFFRLRRAIERAQPDRVITPATPLNDLTARSGTDAWLSRLQDRTGLRMPTLATGIAGGLAAVAAVALSVAAIFAHGWYGALVSLPVSLAMLAASSRWLARFPKGMRTVGDLARAIAALNIAALSDGKEPIRRSEIWAALQGVIQDDLSPVGPVQPTTRFFRAKT